MTITKAKTPTPTQVTFDTCVALLSDTDGHICLTTSWRNIADIDERVVLIVLQQKYDNRKLSFLAGQAWKALRSCSVPYLREALNTDDRIKPDIPGMCPNNSVTNSG